MSRLQGAGMVIFIGLILAGVGCSSCGSSDGDQSNPGQNCPAGQQRGPDGKCHAVGGDLDWPGADLDKDPADGTDSGDEQGLDGTDQDNPNDGDQLDQDTDQAGDGDSEGADGDGVDFDTLENDFSDQTDTDSGDSPDSDNSENVDKNGPCVDDNSCSEHYYCRLSDHICWNDCFANFDCGGSLPPCCNIPRGRCEVCPADEDKPDQDIVTDCPSGLDSQCSIGWVCNPANTCFIECGQVGHTCPVGQYCDNTDHPRCHLNPEEDEGELE